MQCHTYTVHPTLLLLPTTLQSPPLPVCLSLSLQGEGKGGSKSGDYRAQLRRLLMNLRDVANPDLSRRLLSGEIGPEEAATMAESDMASDELKRKRNEHIR